MSKKLDPYQVPHNVEPTLCPKMLQKKKWLLKNYLRNIIIVSSSFGSDRARHTVRPDLGLKGLVKLQKPFETPRDLNDSHEETEMPKIPS